MSPRERLSITGGGWCSYRDLWVQFDVIGGRLEPVSLVVRSANPLTAARLREVSIGEVTALANEPETAEKIRARIGERVYVSLNADFTEIERGRVPRVRSRIPEPPYDDDHYKRVALDYSRRATLSRRPAADMAETNGVPVTTVHTWVKEARKRGFLPPGHRGKAG